MRKIIFVLGMVAMLAACSNETTTETTTVIDTTMVSDTCIVDSARLSSDSAK